MGELRKLGIERLIMISGDNQKVAERWRRPWASLRREVT
jgi:cation transport ATPase